MQRGRANVVSTFLLIKGALIQPTHDVLAHWNLSRTAKENLDDFKQSDRGGIGTANWRRDVAFVLQRRYDLDGQDRILVELATGDVSHDVWRAVLLFHMTRDEFLVRDFLVGWLFGQHASGAWRLRPEDLGDYLAALHSREGIVVKAKWSERTTHDVKVALLRLAVDFGLMTGTSTREFVSYRLPDDAFLYLLHAMIESEPNAHRMVHSPDWRMYLMAPDDVQRELFRLHQLGRLRYAVAGSIAELRLPYPTAAAFARKELVP